METTLGWIAVVIGAVGAVLAAAIGRGREAEERPAGGVWLVAAATVLGTIVLFLLTRPSAPPFSMGGRLGYGILIGGLLGAVAGLWSLRLGGRTPFASGIAAAGLPALALFGVGLTLLIFGGYPGPALGGFIIGAVMAAALFRLGPTAARGMETWALSAVALGATVTLAIFKYDATFHRFWWRAPLVVFALVIVAHFASARFARSDRKYAIPALLASIITLILIAVFAWKVFPNWPLLWVAIMGIVTFALVAWTGASGSGSTWPPAVATLAVVALAAVGFRTLGGFGVGIGLLAAWAILLPALASARAEGASEEQTDSASVVTYAMFIGIGVLMFRLFLENYAGELRGLDLRVHYTFVAIAVGAVFPFVLMSLFPISPNRGALCRTVGAGASGLFAAATPLVIVALWGFKPELGFLVGTFAAEAFILFIIAGAVRVRESRYGESALLVLAAQVAAVQLSGFFGAFAQAPRTSKVIALAVVVVLGLIWAGISARLTRGSVREG